MRRVCLSGTFHSGNRGDASLQLASILELQRRYPGIEIKLLSCFPEADAGLYPGVELVRTRRREPAYAALMIAQAMLARVLRAPRLMLEEVRVIADADVLIDLSGDGFTDTFGWKCPASHAVPLLLARATGTPYALIGQTIGPLRRLQRMYRWLFNCAKLVTCRDFESADYISRLGVNTRSVHLTADVAFLLDAVDKTELQDAYPDLAGPETARVPGQLVLGVTPSNLHNVRETRDRERIQRALADACNCAISQLKARVLVIPTVFGPGTKYDDRVAARELAALLPRDSVLVCDKPLGPRELKAVVGCCDVYFGLRMHGLIYALSQMIPSVGIGYAGKTLSLFKRIGLEPYCVPIDQLQPEMLCDKIMAVYSNRDQIGELTKRSMETDVFPSARRNFDLLCGTESALPTPALCAQNTGAHVSG